VVAALGCTEKARVEVRCSTITDALVLSRSSTTTAAAMPVRKT
jgi:hypothetical protein